MELSCQLYALVALPPGKDTLDGHQSRFGHLGEEKLIDPIGNWNRANSHGHNLLFRKIDNRRCRCTEFAVIWSLDIAGDFTIGEYNAGERKHQKEKGQAGTVQRVRWAHIGLLNLLTFKWRVVRKRNTAHETGLSRAWGDASVSRTHQQRSARSQLYTTRHQNEWEVTSSPWCVASRVTGNFQFRCSAFSILILANTPILIRYFDIIYFVKFDWITLFIQDTKKYVFCTYICVYIRSYIVTTFFAVIYTTLSKLHADIYNLLQYNKLHGHFILHYSIFVRNVKHVGS